MVAVSEGLLLALAIGCVSYSPPYANVPASNGNASVDARPAASGLQIASATPARAPSVVASATDMSSSPGPMPSGVSLATEGTSDDKIYGQATTAIDAKAGDHFTVAVPGNATTAYTWRVDPNPDASVLTVTDPKYASSAPPNCNQCAGHGGTYSFAVSASAVGIATLHLVKVHVGRVPGKPIQEVTITVTVK